MENMTISILIPTLVSRVASFKTITEKINGIINRFSLQDRVFIESYLDNREKSVGFKRNSLLQECKSAYACFVDDDDDIADWFIPKAYNVLASTAADCIKLNGLITVNGKDPRPFVHSAKYTEYATVEGVYVRPPNHLNIIKTEISKKFLFPEKNFGEDTDWAMQLCRSKVIKREAAIGGQHKDKPYYFYKYDTVKSETTGR
jgi:hypothetical protein